MFAIALPALGSAILFNIGSSSGGTDIIAMILKKFTSVDMLATNEKSAAEISPVLAISTARPVIPPNVKLFGNLKK